MTFKRTLSAILSLSLATTSLTLLSSPQAIAQDEGAEKKDGPPSIEEKVDGLDQLSGFFSFYTDPVTGQVFMEFTEDQLDQEFIAFSYTENGTLEAGHFRGAYRDNRVLSLKKHFEKIEVIEENTAFYFDEESALSRAKEANISPAILASLKIEAYSEGTDEAPARYLVDAGKLFLNESLHQVKASPRPGGNPNAFKLGNLSSSKTKFSDFRTYSDNVDVVVDYIYDLPAPTNQGSPAVTDARSVSIKMQHSFLAMPDDGFEPRFDDYRVGYFFDQVTDLTSPDAAPYRDLVNRWRLVKKDPTADISDPVKPITWWIENTTPVEYRDVIRDATLAWNQSFEKAGFSNAIEVKVQPDDAEWDAGDIQYNVLRWTSSPIPPFGGYGPSFTNPRTGEIIGADIMLEYVFLTNRLALADIFETAGLPAQTPAHSAHAHNCSFGHHLQTSNLFGIAHLQASGASESEIQDLVKEGLYYLILHEVGHTLGLNHNMKASSVYGPKEVHDKSVTNGAPAGSVMDYPAVNIAPLGMEQGDYYVQRPGSYDDWAIEFGYHPTLEDPTAEKERSETLLARSVENGNLFGNDADDMRAPGRGIDPRVNIGDMSSDPVAYAIDRIELSKSVLNNLVEKYEDKNSWQSLLQAYLITSGQHAGMAQVISRQVGGVYVDRTPPTQGVETAPFTPVPVETQKAAMRALGNYVFAADAFDVPTELAMRLQAQRRGFNFFGGTEDPKLHNRVLGIQQGVLNHLLHPAVLQRLTDSQLYGGEYSATEMLLDLNTIIFGEDLTRSGNTFRRNIQIAYLERLVGIVDGYEFDTTSQEAALAAIQDIQSRMGLVDFHLSAETKAHRMHVKRILWSF